ncbi:OLC1v1011209C1 [Oldenlandia corymbosa var. corymbosa]|uniref:OLC1v1011209C1 n=1 Tax=Oldenlandia corymbosa var. corymbosa TaxID=529605 RepID=A0AAV1DW94_OLDCO|nr:OLC1v1011209C1 [Oldenlandia corymbosa var. corymbosa]
MGVHGLWDLLSPVGRRVSVETLAGKRLAIDASIWMIQFMKAMRDEKGEMVRNAHLLGFFRRICKLLYLRTKPVFIFDGGTPALKRRTVIARRRQRENAQAKIRKTAEKLLLNQLKKIRLQEVADHLENQRKSNVDKGKKIATEETDFVDKTSAATKSFVDCCNQEELDELLAASIAAEEQECFPVAESSSAHQIQTEDEDGYEDEEMILPAIEGKIDPAILAALPPSMQLDLLVQMRERLMAENRKKYQRVKKVPARFSELQIEAYLKTVAFRREIDEVQKSAAGRGVGGVQTSRIASEANREFIFSSNYDGDKSVLTSNGEASKNNDQSIAPIVNPFRSATDTVASLEKSSAVGISAEEPQKGLENDVETYLDERGRVRVSRMRAMGIRMTRDIQRNLDLMKEVEEERVEKTGNLRDQSAGHGATQDSASGEIQFSQASRERTPENGNNEETVLDAGTSIEISFEDTGQHELGSEDDDLFAQLVAGDPVMDFSLDDSLSKKQSVDSASDLEWEEAGKNKGGSSDIELEGNSNEANGMSLEQELEWVEGGIENEGNVLSNKEVKGNSLLANGRRTEQEFEREEGFGGNQEDISASTGCKKVFSKGSLEEEADFQEAIRRSLQDLDSRITLDDSNVVKKSISTAESVSLVVDARFTQKEGDLNHGEAPSRFVSIQHNDPVSEFQETINGAAIVVKGNSTRTSDPLEARHLGGSCGKMEVLPVNSQDDLGLQDTNQYMDAKCFTEQELSDLVSSKANGNSKVQPSYASGNDNMITSGDDQSKQATEPEEACEKYLVKDVNITQESAAEELHEFLSKEVEESFDKVTSSYDRKEEVEITRASLAEEMSILDEECKELGDMQRKLERTAESVNNEMFTECQELLQMFGLPYIIAPMEAEAQCAYMELVNLVDGVVTDDSDVFLFGARSVYKNIFDDRKYVETYFMKDIENELGLNREKLIRMAMLLGSDYTEGVSGIGIVNAIEVVNAFPEEDGLRKFREWIESPDPSILGKLDVQAGGSARQIEPQVSDMESCSSHKGVKGRASNGNASGSEDEVSKIKQTFMDKHRNVSKNWHIPPSFPSEAVVSAYNSPHVDKSTDPFSWGKPDHLVLRKLCWEKFGWSTQKADELLLPVLREYDKRETQLRLEAFYFNERFAKIRSKRIKKAVKGIAGNSDLVDDSAQVGSTKKKRRKVNKDDGDGVTPGKASQGKEFADASNEVIVSEKLHGKLSKKTRRKANPSSELAKSSSDDDICNDRGQDSQGSSREPSQVRRSGRPRKAVNYALNDIELDEPNQDDGNPNKENLAGKEPCADMPEAGYSAAVPSKIQAVGRTDPEFNVECTGLDESSHLNEAKQDKVTDQLSACPVADSLTESQLSGDYLTTGGGFCLDEDDTAENVQGLSTRSTSVEICDSDPSKGSGLKEDGSATRPIKV